MTEEERDNGLEDLFHDRLEENELVAGSDLTGRFMRRLERREFFRFNLSRFNIYYLTAAMAGLTVAGVILFSGAGNDEGSDIPDNRPVPAAAAVTTDPGSGQEEDPVKDDTGAGAISPDQAPESGPGTETPPPGEAASRESAIISGRSASETISVSAIGNAADAAVTPPVILLSVEPSVTSGCIPLHVTFSSNAGDGIRLNWNFGDGGTSSLRNPDYIYDIPGTYRVTLTATDSRGRSYAASSVIEVWNRPKAAFEAIKDDSWDQGDRVRFNNLSTGAVNYLWDFGDGTFSTLSDPSYRYGYMGVFDVKLVAWSAEGCADSLTVSDLFTDRGMYIRFPNAFVPNRGGPTGGYYNQRTDEESQVFHPVASGIASYNLKIYSKAGLLVFESNEIELGWDGYYRGELCTPGVYVWKVRGTYRNGQTFIMAGDVTLINY
ncbi:MAG: PKD domain-containing protein [Bacteroidales bacterium]|jgi:hypothetical protein|nr:PKD domain-containing protein [Bacteroidales bacterium]